MKHATMFLTLLGIFTFPVYAEQATVQFPRTVDDDTVHKCFVTGVRNLTNVDFQKASLSVEYDPVVTNPQKLLKDLKQAVGFDVSVKAVPIPPTAAVVGAATSAPVKKWVKPGSSNRTKTDK